MKKDKILYFLTLITYCYMVPFSNAILVLNTDLYYWNRYQYFYQILIFTVVVYLINDIIKKTDRKYLYSFIFIALIVMNLATVFKHHDIFFDNIKPITNLSKLSNYDRNKRLLKWSLASIYYYQKEFKKAYYTSKDVDTKLELLSLLALNKHDKFMKLFLEVDIPEIYKKTYFLLINNKKIDLKNKQDIFKYSLNDNLFISFIKEQIYLLMKLRKLKSKGFNNVFTLVNLYYKTFQFDKIIEILSKFDKDPIFKHIYLSKIYDYHLFNKKRAIYHYIELLKIKKVEFYENRVIELQGLIN